MKNLSTKIGQGFPVYFPSHPCPTLKISPYPPKTTNHLHKMNVSTRAFAVLSMAAAVGDRVKTHGHTDNIRGAGYALETAALDAASKYPTASLSKNISKIAISVIRLLSGPLDPQELLSMLLAGLSDIQAQCNPKRYDLVESVIIPARTCLDFYPGDIDHEAAFTRYLAWAS